ncbi:ParA family protein [Tranquillimonas alkanivorans]|uniref:Chromosome partitioning protein n=1 Tax=Tranquillimonas alkanivorans TaxID=441119 RepID=A0A1I5W2T7_9RHOB|nr:AAA family ATPase [Tranquillimonas alkanivorans]SFQ14010.1 chromosome partitioning protein [Tranquillimonas alkanivorans]
MSLLDFVQHASEVMKTVDLQQQRRLTLRSRVRKTFSTRDLAGLFGVEYGWLRNHLMYLQDKEPALPQGVLSGRDRAYTPDEAMMMRAVLQVPSAGKAKYDYLFWRQPGDPLPVVTFGAQKGGTGKSLTAAHFAQYLNLNYGLRVGIIDSDPQATASLYFADDKISLDASDMTKFIGASEPGMTVRDERSAEELDAMWQPTPWPGVRLLPGGPEITSGDIALFFLAKNGYAVHRFLKDSIAQWDEGCPPTTRFADLRKADGSFDVDRYRTALTETLDVIIIDQQPSLTLMQLNGVVAATNLVIPQTVKGIDLSTLTTYVNGIRDALEYFVDSGTDKVDDIGAGQHIILPTIVQEANEQDKLQVRDLYLKAMERGQELFASCFYTRSDAIANASEEYKSIYEYDPPRSRKASAKNFITNANAVNDFLVSRIWENFPTRGYSEAFIKEHWTEDGAQ